MVVPLVDAPHAAGPLHTGRVQHHVPPGHLVPAPLPYLVLGTVALLVGIARSVLDVLTHTGSSINCINVSVWFWFLKRKHTTIKVLKARS